MHTLARPKNRVFLKENRPPFFKSAPQGVGRAARTLGRVRLPSDLALRVPVVDKRVNE